MSGTGSSFGEIEEIQDIVERKFMRLRKFEIFDQYPPEDHHYKRFLNSLLTSSSLKSQIFPKNSFSKAIEKEIYILEESLPDWIFVRVYSSRYDLMRVAISGLENTPYRYGLFFFDIFIPHDYPSQPPQIFYHSYGHSFTNSKLRQDGRVSLPILEDQNWVPHRFTILHVLKYIQHSVLNFVPKLEYSVLKEQISDEKERKQDFIRTSEAMLSILEKPPRGFGDFVAGYFRKWSHRILLSYKEEMEKHDESTNDLKLFVRLLKAFEFNGSYCGHHYDDKVRSMLKDDDQRDRKDDFSLEKPIDLFKLVWQ